MEFCQEVTQPAEFSSTCIIINQTKVRLIEKREDCCAGSLKCVHTETRFADKCDLYCVAKSRLDFPAILLKYLFSTDDVNYFVGFNLDQRVSWWKYKTHVGVEDWGRNIILVLYIVGWGVFIYGYTMVISVIIWW